MDIFQKIEKEHKDVQEWCDSILETSPKDVETREDYFKRIYTTYTAHKKAEEEVLNPFLREKKETSQFAVLINEDHNVIDFLMEQLRDLPVDSENWIVKFSIMRDQLQRHFDNELGSIASQSRQAFQNDRLANLIEQFERNMNDRKKNLENTYTKR